MYLFSRERRRRYLRMKRNQLELASLAAARPNQPRRILRFTTMKKEHSDVSNQRQQTIDNTDDEELEESLPRFGPCYGMDKKSVLETKERALDHVMRKTSPQTPSMATEIYLSAIRRAEEEATKIYRDEIKCSASKFRLMMIRDGCFFLQLVFVILDHPGLLGYPSNDLIFGENTFKNDIIRWIKAMFFVGNQIPLVILEELLKEKFFQDTLTRENWDIPRSTNQLTLCQQVLYKVLIMPKLVENQQRAVAVEGKPSDLLQALHNFVMGPDPRQKKFSTYQAQDDFDLEANVNGQGQTTSETSIGFPSATSLKRSSISIKKLKSSEGVRNISFRSYYFWATIYLPVFPIGQDTKILLSNLKTYEARHIQRHKRETTSYMRFMSDLVETPRDVKLLKRTGVIQGSLGNDYDDEEELPELLSSLRSTGDVTLTLKFSIFRRKIKEYSPPWRRIKDILSLVVFLTLVQAFFAVLAYFRPPNQTNSPMPPTGSNRTAI